MRQSGASEHPQIPASEFLLQFGHDHTDSRDVEGVAVLHQAFALQCANAELGAHQSSFRVVEVFVGLVDFLLGSLHVGPFGLVGEFGGLGRIRTPNFSCSRFQVILPKYSAKRPSRLQVFLGRIYRPVLPQATALSADLSC